MADACTSLIAAAQHNAAAQRNAAVIAYVKEHVADAVDDEMVDFFLLTVVDFAGAPFPIPGDEAMKWLDYGRSDNFKRFYTRHLVLDVDYKVSLRAEVTPSAGGPVPEEVHFTVDGFKDLCAVAGTDQGRRVRGYYRTLEKIHAQYFIRAQLESDAQLAASAALLEETKAEKDALRIELHEQVKDAQNKQRRFADSAGPHPQDGTVVQEEGPGDRRRDGRGHHRVRLREPGSCSRVRASGAHEHDHLVAPRPPAEHEASSSGATRIT